MIDEDIEQHRCRVGIHCCAGTPEGAAVTLQPNTICHICVIKLQHQLDQLAGRQPIKTGDTEATVQKLLRDSVQLSLVPQGGGAKVSTGKREAPVPLNLHALDVIDELDQVLDLVGGSTIANLIRQGPELVTVRIKGNPEQGWIDGVHKAMAVGVVWRKIDSIIGISIAWEQRHAACNGCGRRTLGSYAGADHNHYASCSNCGATFTRDEYGALCDAELKKKQKRNT
ncbi:hypothetical protein FHT44_004966 [Mycolicibacterium sp. BK634]|uniref:hypothetical protein n=1 Tax=Mycolicibacterium sp. BK634 TaxID=2587099 RepID=UPI00160E1B2B|nr:hypothetical protein [Mycolicibacterium sp. BK634]MBB3752454.1 hypothetical protein [Mycolicibacterium sp. BK634]